MNKLQRYIITAAITLIILYIVWFFGDIIKIILISAVLSLMGKPLVDFLSKVEYKERKIIPSWLSATVTLVAMWGIAVALIMLFTPVITSKIESLSNFSIGDIKITLDRLMGDLDRYLSSKFQIHLQDPSRKGLLESVEDQIQFTVSDSIKGIGSLLDKIATIAMYAFSVSFITFFFLKESALFTNSIAILFPEKSEQNALRAISSSINLLSRYFIGLMCESFLKLVIITAGFCIIGIPFGDALIASLITAILNVIPYIGPLIGGAIALLLGLTSDAAAQPELLLWQMGVILVIFQLIDNIIIQPYIYGESVKAHPLEIFLVILMAGSMAGVTGMLLAIPAYTVLRVFAKEFFNRFRVVKKLTENI